jgi:hypothetical protein
MAEAVASVRRGDLVEHALHRIPARFSRASLQCAEELFDFAEDHLDRIQVGAVGRAG